MDWFAGFSTGSMSLLLVDTLFFVFLVQLKSANQIRTSFLCVVPKHSRFDNVYIYSLVLKYAPYVILSTYLTFKVDSILLTWVRFKKKRKIVWVIVGVKWCKSGQLEANLHAVLLSLHRMESVLQTTSLVTGQLVLCLRHKTFNLDWWLLFCPIQVIGLRFSSILSETGMST